MQGFVKIWLRFFYDKSQIYFKITIIYIEIFPISFSNFQFQFSISENVYDEMNQATLDAMVDRVMGSGNGKEYVNSSPWFLKIN